MEPRPHERGNACQSVWLTNTHATLQWSHVLTNVETSAAVVVWLMENDPSMEPRPHERGNQGLRLASGGPADPSMEPRPHERGNRQCRRRARVLPSPFNGATSSRTWKH